MNIGIYGILILFGLFIFFLIFNPKLSCFGKRLKSPFYPLLRKKRQQKKRSEDYGFRLTDETKSPGSSEKSETKKKVDDYGFRLD